MISFCPSEITWGEEAMMLPLRDRRYCQCESELGRPRHDHVVVALQTYRNEPGPPGHRVRRW